MIYLISFFASCTFFWFSEKNKNKFIKNLLAIIAILIPCILAALRSNIIGTDVKVYVEPMYNAAKESYNLSSYMTKKWYVIWRYMYVNKFEIGFSLMIYLIEKIGGSLSTVFFVIQLLIVAPIYFGLKRFNKPYPIYFGMLVFYLMFYNTSLNMMRQWIAMSFLFLALSYLTNKNIKKYGLFVVVSSLFHTSALIIGGLIMLIYLYTIKRKYSIRICSYKLKDSIKPMNLFFYGCLTLLLLNVIAIILTKIGLSKYSGYIRGDNGIHILPKQFLLRLPIMALLIIRWKKIVKEDKLSVFYASMMVLDLLASQLMSINAYAFRIASFFSEYNILSYSALVYAGEKRNKFMRLFYVFAYIVCYWIYFYVIVGSHKTFPYVFA